MSTRESSLVDERNLELDSVAPVVQVFHFVDPDEPVLCCVRLLKRVQLEVFVPDFGVADSVNRGSRHREE